jgi:hypothetical protein
MRRYRALIAIGALLLPIVLRGLWFYGGFYRPAEVELPDFEALTVPTPLDGEDEAVEETMESTRSQLVLIDFAHDNFFQMSEIDSLLRSLSERGASVEIIRSSFETGVRSVEEQLKHADAYIVIAPQTTFSKSLVAEVEDFVARGGRLLVISDPTRGDEYLGYYESDFYFSYGIGSVEAANTILAPFHLTFNDDYVYNLLENEGNYRNVVFKNFAEDPLTESLSGIAFYGAHSLQTKLGKAIVIGDENTSSSRRATNEAIVAAARSPDLGVLAFGDLSFFSPPYDQVADNEVFIERIVGFLLGGEGKRDLRNYPYIFRQNVGILRTEVFDVDADTLSTLTELENFLDEQGLTLSVIEEPQDDLDLIVMATFEQGSTEEIKPFLEAFPDLVLPGASPDEPMTVPEIGEIQPSGIGLLLLTGEEGQTSLVLLAETSDGVFTLSESLAWGDLSGCLVREMLAVCRVGAAGGFDGYDYDFEDFDYDYDFDDSLLEDIPPVDEPTPMPTPDLPSTIVPSLTPTPSL